MSEPLPVQYTRRLQSVRNAVGTHAGIRGLFDPETSPQVLHRFLIEYCALGVQLTAPVEGWIRRAGARCQALGLGQLGGALVKHAAQEAGHDRLFVDDTHALVALYNERYATALSAAHLLQQAKTRAMERYIELHEVTISGDTPFAQVAIELEIEQLSCSLGAPLLAQLERRLEQTVVGCLSFLKEHVAVDVSHTALNQKLMARLLDERPAAFEALVHAGESALTAYADFLGECLERARSDVARTQRA